MLNRLKQKAENKGEQKAGDAIDNLFGGKKKDQNSGTGQQGQGQGQGEGQGKGTGKGPDTGGAVSPLNNPEGTKPGLAPLTSESDRAAARSWIPGGKPRPVAL